MSGQGLGIEYRIGDASVPCDDNVVIAHIVNDVGAWGAGFTRSLDRLWPTARDTYRAHHDYNLLLLGETVVSLVECGYSNAVFIAHNCAQNGLPSKANPVPLDYNALHKCLYRLGVVVSRFLKDCTVQMPRIGAGLAGGDWKIIEATILDTLCSRGIKVVVFDLEEKK